MTIPLLPIRSSVFRVDEYDQPYLGDKYSWISLAVRGWCFHSSFKISNSVGFGVIINGLSVTCVALYHLTSEKTKLNAE